MYITRNGERFELTPYELAFAAKEHEKITRLKKAREYFLRAVTCSSTGAENYSRQNLDGLQKAMLTKWEASFDKVEKYLNPNSPKYILQKIADEALKCGDASISENDLYGTIIQGLLINEMIGGDELNGQ
jgi:hypothetical protein